LKAQCSVHDALLCIGRCDVNHAQVLFGWPPGTGTGLC
jgi:hypothetical protein